LQAKKTNINWRCFFLAGAGEEVMHDQILEATICITIQYMYKLGAYVDSVVCASIDIEREKSVPNHKIT
jgi:hypothetical protein